MTQEELVEEALRIAREKAFPGMNEEDREELIEKAMLSLIDRKAMTPYFTKVGLTACGGFNASSGLYLLHEEPRLPAMPEKPTLIDFFERRILLNRRGGTHLLQSARLAMQKGLSDNIVLACLLHDVAVVSHVRCDHG